MPPSDDDLVARGRLDSESEGKPGVCIWFTGLSGSGKSTTARALRKLLAPNGRYVSVLDGDVVRSFLSTGLGFSRTDRDTNVRRIGFVAAEIVRHGGTVLCPVISPYRDTRAEVRAMFAPSRFIEVFIDCPLSVCEARDVKGLYAAARAGRITHFTGIDDPYEPPFAAEIVVSTLTDTAEGNARIIVEYLVERGLVDCTPLTSLAIAC